MLMDSIQKLKDIFTKFPTIGSRTAGRFVAYLLTLSPKDLSELTEAIEELKKKVSLCSFCFNHFESDAVKTGGGLKDARLCPICSDLSRNGQLLCVVEKEADLATIENTKKYRGFYFVINEALGNKKNYLETLRTKELKERILHPEKFGLSKASFQEIILATNPTPEGKVTSATVERALKELPSSTVKITHLAQGLPVGGELEYADQETLESAFEGRK